MPFPGTTQIPLLFAGGLESKIAKFSLDQPNLEDAINCRYTVAGQVEKRPGFTALSRNVLGGGYIEAGAAVNVFNNELVLFDGQSMYSWQDDERVWVRKGSAFSLSTGQTRVLNTKIATQSNPDAFTCSAGTLAAELTLYVWEDNRTAPSNQEGVRYTIVDTSTGALVVSDALLFATALRPKVIGFQETILNDTWMVTYEASASSIYASMVRSSRPNIVSPFVQLTQNGMPTVGGTQTIPYDLSNVTVGSAADSTVYFVFGSTTGLRLEVLQPAFGSVTIAASALVTAATDTVCCAVFATGPNEIWVAWSNASRTFCQSFTAAGVPISAVFLVQLQPSVNIALGQVPGSTGTLSMTCEVAGTASGGNFLNVYTVATVPQYVGQQRGVGLASKPYVQGGNIFVTAVYPSSLQATYFTLCLTAPLGIGPNSFSGMQGAIGFEVVAKHAPSNGGGLRTNGLLSECQAFGSSGFLFAGQRKGPFISYGDAQTVVLGVAGYSVGFASTDSFNSVTSNNNLHITGGVKKVYDGISVVEDNFHVFPELLALPAGATFPTLSPTSTNLLFAGNGCSVTLSAGGNLTASSSYQYKIVYTWPDNYGQVQRSGPSVATQVTTTGDGKLTATLTIPTLRLTDKMSSRSPVSIEVYRTQANLPIFYKVTSDTSPLLNDTTVDFVNFVDALADGPPTNTTTPNIAANENIYTDTQLANSAPPGCTLVSLFQNRLVINQNEDPSVVWYSQNKFDLSQYNTLPLDWNTSFVEGIDSRGGGPVSALGLLDASLAVFKPTSVYLLNGAGPNTFLTAGEFGDAQLLVSDTGCTNQNSLVFVTQTTNSPGGLLFKSAKGIYLLGRDSSLTYIGHSVEEFNGLTITSANILSTTNEIVFTTLEGTALVYNYYFNAWTTWQSLPAIDAVVWQGQLVILKADGTVMAQDLTGTVWQDTGSNGVVTQVQRKVTTPWVKLSGLQGYQAVYNCLLLGQFAGPHTMTVQVRYDYNPSVVETVSWNGSLVGAHWGSLPIWGTPFGTWGNTSYSTYQFQINLANPRCQAVQLTFIDDANDTQGSILNGLVFEVMALPGPQRLPAQNLVASTGNNR